MAELDDPRRRPLKQHQDSLYRSRHNIPITSGSIHGDFVLLGGPSSENLSQKIANHLGIPLGDTRVGQFPDGETNIQINTNVRGKDVFII